MSVHNFHSVLGELTDLCGAHSEPPGAGHQDRWRRRACCSIRFLQALESEPGPLLGREPVGRKPWHLCPRVPRAVGSPWCVTAETQAPGVGSEGAGSECWGSGRGAAGPGLPPGHCLVSLWAGGSWAISFLSCLCLLSPWSPIVLGARWGRHGVLGLRDSYVCRPRKCPQNGGAPGLSSAAGVATGLMGSRGRLTVSRKKSSRLTTHVFLGAFSTAFSRLASRMRTARELWAGRWRGKPWRENVRLPRACRWGSWPMASGLPPVTSQTEAVPEKAGGQVGVGGRAGPSGPRCHRGLASTSTGTFARYWFSVQG